MRAGSTYALQHTLGLYTAVVCHADLAKCAEEGVEMKLGAMETLGKVSNGDLRKAITTLQSAVRLKASL